MDFLKELPSALSKVVEPVFGNSRVCFIAFVGLTLLLALPARWLAPVGLDVVHGEYRWIAGLLWFVFGLASVYHLVRFTELKWQESKGSTKERARMRKRLERLTEEQKVILRRFIDNDGLSMRLRVNKDIRELEESGVLCSPLSSYGPKDLDEEGLFWVDSWAMGHLMKNRSLLG